MNSVAPGLIETDMIENAPIEHLLKLIPMRRLGRPEEVAKLAVFLASGDASYITGPGDRDQRGPRVSSGNRVVVTGIGMASPIGNNLREASARTSREGRHGIVRRPDWDSIGSLGTRLAAEVQDDRSVAGGTQEESAYDGPGRSCCPSTRRKGPSTTPVSRPELIASGRVGLAYGSTHGSTTALERFCRSLFRSNDLKGLGREHLPEIHEPYLRPRTWPSTTKFEGRVVSTCAACVSASVAIGTGYELIKNGQQDVMICGGAEELHFTHVGVFDIMYATSTRYNEEPGSKSAPL